MPRMLRTGCWVIVAIGAVGNGAIIAEWFDVPEWVTSSGRGFVASLALLAPLVLYIFARKRDRRFAAPALFVIVELAFIGWDLWSRWPT